jgi:hypothetical protein
MRLTKTKRKILSDNLERMKDEKHKINMIKPGMKHKIEQPVYFLITHVPLFLFISCIQEKMVKEIF